MTDEERKLALYCLKASSDYHSEVCEECIKYPNCDHTEQDDVTETIIKALEQEPCGDAISRILKRMWNCRGNHTTSIDKVKMEQIIRDELSSATTESKIGCEGCIYEKNGK